MPQIFTYDKKLFYLVNYSPRGSASIKIILVGGDPGKNILIGNRSDFSAYVFAVSLFMNHEVSLNSELSLLGDLYISLYEFGHAQLGIGFYYFHPSGFDLNTFSVWSTSTPLPFSSFFHNLIIPSLNSNIGMEYMSEIYFGSSTQPLYGILKDAVFTMAGQGLPIIRGTLIMDLPAKVL